MTIEQQLKKLQEKIKDNVDYKKSRALNEKLSDFLWTYREELLKLSR